MGLRMLSYPANPDEHVFAKNQMPNQELKAHLAGHQCAEEDSCLPL